MPIEVHFESESLRKEFEKEKKLLSKHGSGRASLIKQRLAEFQAAACLEDLRHLPGHAFTSIPGCQEGRPSSLSIWTTPIASCSKPTMIRNRSFPEEESTGRRSPEFLSRRSMIPMADTFTPDYAVHPGATLKESLDSSGMSQTELAERTGLSRKTINGIVNGKEPLTHETALQLEKVFRVPARFWVNLQANHDETVARLRERSRLESFRDWIREREIPYAELARRGLVPATRDPLDRLAGVLQFFGVSNPEAFESVWGSYQKAYSFRKSEKLTNHFGAIAAWLRLGEMEAEKIACNPFEKKKLLAVLDEMRAMALLPCKEFQERLPRHCAQSGIALVFVPGIKGAPIFGATRWLPGKRKAIVQLSLRGKDDGNLWFTFFHELGHVLLHDRSAIFLELDRAMTSKEEREASNFARDLLIPPGEFAAFLDQHKRTNPEGFRMISKVDIVAFARRIGIPPGVVVGRLQKDGYIPPRNCNGLKQRFEFCGEDL